MQIGEWAIRKFRLMDRYTDSWRKSWPCTVPVISDSSPRPRFPRSQTISRDLRLLCSRPSSLVVVSRDDLPILRGSNIWQRKLLALHPYRDNKAVYETCIRVHQETLSVQWILLHIATRNKIIFKITFKKECTYYFCAAFTKITGEHSFHHITSGSENRFMGWNTSII